MPNLNLYWLYDLESWQFLSLIVGFFTVIGIVGLVLTRRWVKRLHKIEHSHNDIVGFYLAGVTVFYGITLGLVAVGTWDTYSDVQNRVDREAVAVGGLYRDVGAFPEPTRTILQSDLRTYARAVIDISWPEQRRGIVPNSGSAPLNVFQSYFMSFEPQTEQQKIVAAEVYHAFNNLTECRRARLNSVTAELPGPVWIMVVCGALLSIATTWFFHTASFSMHFWLTILFCVLIGLLIYLIAALDNPYRGRISIGPEAMERVYQQIMIPQH
jgi:uncharacterized membrane protein YedE/YeeE